MPASPGTVPRTPVPKRRSASNGSSLRISSARIPTRVERLAAVLRDAEILGPPMYFMELPLWDIIGKRANLPVYQLWGAASDRVAAYCATAEIRSPEQRVRDAERIVAEGYRAMKLRFHNDDPRDDLKVVEAIRAKLGDRIEIMVDANQAGVEPGLTAAISSGAFSARSRWHASWKSWACCGWKNRCIATTTPASHGCATSSTR